MPTDGPEREEPGCDGREAADGAPVVSFPCTTDRRLPLATRISSLAVRPSGPTDGSPAAGILDGAAVGSTVCATVGHAVGDAVGEAVGAADILADRSAAVAAVITIGYSRGVTDPDADDPDSLVVTRRTTFSLRAVLHSRPPARGSCWGRTRAWPVKGQSRSEGWGTLVSILPTASFDPFRII